MEILLFVIAIAVLFLVLDMLQTLQIALNPQKWKELNPILGEHPSWTAVCSYFMICIWLTVMIALWLPGPWGAAFAGAIALLEIVVVWRNRYVVGVPFR